MYWKIPRDETLHKKPLEHFQLSNKELGIGRHYT